MRKCVQCGAETRIVIADQPLCLDRIERRVNDRLNEQAASEADKGERPRKPPRPPKREPGTLLLRLA